MITTFHLPTKLVFGAGSLNQLGAEAKELGRKAIIVTYQSDMLPSGLLDRVVQELKSNGVEPVVFDKIVPNPRASTVDEGARLVRQEGVDLVVGLGGGSAMDSAKGVVLASAGDKSIWDYVGTKIEVSRPVLPLLMVPTVAATASEANEFAVFTNWEKRQKALVFTPYMYPRVSIIDPELTVSLPKKPTAQGGVDIFCHAVEGYITTQTPSPITDGITETAMRTAVLALPKALAKPDDIEARASLLWASIIANSPFLTLGGGSGRLTLHGMSTPLSGYFDVAHGDGLAAMLPAWMRFTEPVKPERFRSLGRNVFGEEDGIAATEKWLDKVGMRLRLRDIGVKPEVFDEVAARIEAAGRTKGHPKLLDAAAIKQIYQEAY